MEHIKRQQTKWKWYHDKRMSNKMLIFPAPNSWVREVFCAFFFNDSTNASSDLLFCLSLFQSKQTRTKLMERILIILLCARINSFLPPPFCIQRFGCSTMNLRCRACFVQTCCSHRPSCSNTELCGVQIRNGRRSTYLNVFITVNVWGAFDATINQS